MSLIVKYRGQPVQFSEGRGRDWGIVPEEQATRFESDQIALARALDCIRSAHEVQIVPAPESATEAQRHGETL